MAHLSESLMTLRIFGEALDPDEITRLLGAAPSSSRRRGDVRARSKDGREIIAKEGMWLLNVEKRTPEDTDGQVAEMLGRLTNDLSIWLSLCQQYRVDLFCGWIMQETNEGLYISPETMAALAARGIKLGIDIYAPRSDDEKSASS